LVIPRAVAVSIIATSLGASCKDDATTTRARDRETGSAKHGSSAARAEPAGFRDGDLIFHESTSAQSEMVRALTASRWTHMGVVFVESGRPHVLEAVSPVRRTPVREWIARGKDRRFVVKRLRDADEQLTPEAVAKMKALGASWLGRPYDSRFRWDDQALYCSELAFKIFQRGAGVELGKLERADDMNLDDERVQQALRKRFVSAKFDPSETVVTPDSIFHDDELVEVETSR
jgi:hypothetical protein